MTQDIKFSFISVILIVITVSIFASLIFSIAHLVDVRTSLKTTTFNKLLVECDNKIKDEKSINNFNSDYIEAQIKRCIKNPEEI